MKEDFWKMFLGLGTIDSYLLYKLSENQGDENGRNQNTGADTQFK